MDPARAQAARVDAPVVDLLPEPLLRLRGLRYAANGRTLFDGVDLTVRPGECVVILGHSGCGKSTLFDLITGEVRGYRGKIELDRRDAALLTQDGALLDHLSVIGNLRLIRRFNRRRATVKPEALLSELNVDPSLHRRAVTTLSGGERRRVAIARALVRRPKLVLFDEPDTGLDVNNIREIGRAVRDLVQAEGCGVVIATHNPWFAALVATRVYTLHGGALTQIQDWPEAVELDDAAGIAERRDDLEAELDRLIAEYPSGRARRRWLALPIFELFRGFLPFVSSLPPISRSPWDYLKVFAKTVHLDLITGALFFLLVGGMLGATTIAVIKALTMQSLTGILKYLLKPEIILRLINGSYVVYLAPAVAAILFVARSGSIITGWLGTLSLGRQLRALRGLGVNPNRYLRSPVIWALVLGYLVTVLVFGVGMWYGSVFTAQILYDVEDAAGMLRFPQYMITVSKLPWKVALYSVYIAYTVTALGMAPKSSSEQVAVHTTKAIIYTTIAVALTELVFALDVVESLTR